MQKGEIELSLIKLSFKGSLFYIRENMSLPIWSFIGWKGQALEKKWEICAPSHLYETLVLGRIDQYLEKITSHTPILSFNHNFTASWAEKITKNQDDRT